MVTTECTMNIAKQHLDIPEAAMQEWVNVLTPDILGHKRTSNTVVQFYLKAFVLQYRKLQHAYPYAQQNIITPVAIARTVQRLTSSSVIQEHAQHFTRMWKLYVIDLQNRENQINKTNPLW